MKKLISIFFSTLKEGVRWNVCWKGCVISIIIVAICSCKTTMIPGSKRLKPMKVQKLYDNIISNYLDYKTLSIKFSSKIEENISFNGNLRIKSDSIIWISLSSIFGIEVARIMLTPDSLKFIDRLQKKYYTGDYKYLNKIFLSDEAFPSKVDPPQAEAKSDLSDETLVKSDNIDLDYFTIQSILTNELFIYPYSSNTLEAIKDYKLYVDSNLYCLQSHSNKEIAQYLKNNPGKSEDKFIVQTIYVVPEIYTVNKIHIKEYQNKIDTTRHVNLSYFNYSREIGKNSKKIPKNIIIDLKKLDDLLNFSIKYSKITVDKELRYPFKISGKYQRIK